MLETSVTPATSLYIHVPFCARKCGYCAFYSEPATRETRNRYLAALKREFRLLPHPLRPPTLYFGGGTPSVLNRSQWQDLLQTMDRLNLLGVHETTIECNPATVSLDKARLWRDHGINRLSLGAQSLDDQLLKRLGRIHTRDMVIHTFERLRQAGFDNIGLDLMFAIPGQSLDAWRATLDEALALEPEHLSAYEVIYEEDTPLYAQLHAGEFSVDEDLAAAMYTTLLDTAAAHGFDQYEIANFARSTPRCTTKPLAAEAARPSPPAPICAGVPALACRHNVNYWRGGSYHGLGPSAASYVNGIRAKNWSDTTLYCEHLERGQRPIESRDELPPLARAGEIAAFGFRMLAGWGFAEFLGVTGFDLRQQWRAELQELCARGWAVQSADRFRLTPEGLRFADAVAEMLLR